MLEHALEDLLTKREFEKISVGDIAEAATLNRATFYAHFVDKSDLLEAMVVTRFQHLLDTRGVQFDGTCPSAIYALVLAVCDFLAEIPYCPKQRQVTQHLELAMVGIVRNMLAEGLRRHPSKAGVDHEMRAAALAGAIYASAKQAVQPADRASAEQAAKTVFKLVVPMLESE